MNLDGWIPVRVWWPAREPEPFVDWCLIGESRFTDPCFADTLHRCMNHPFHHVFRRRTPVHALCEWRRERPGAEVAGLIFHMSRCGSKLLAWMLGTVEPHIVLSEARPLEALLRRAPDSAAEQEQIEWVRGMASALGWRRSPSEQQMFIKFDAWCIAALPLMTRVFAGVPWVFLYRDPLEVLASHTRAPEGWTIPALLAPSALGLDQEAELSWQEYRVRALARICELALKHRSLGCGLFVNYSQLPEAGWSEVAGHFGLEPSEEDLRRMQQAACRDAQTPAVAFEPDRDAPSGLTKEARELASRWLDPLYREMEAVRAGMVH